MALFFEAPTQQFGHATLVFDYQDLHIPMLPC
jgi:hypothetical protein